MEHATGNLLVVATTLIVLGDAFAALKLAGKEPEATSSVADDIAVSLLSKQIEDV